MFFSRFYWASLGFTGFYFDSMGFARFLQNSTEFQLVSVSCTSFPFFWVWIDFYLSGFFHWVLPSFPGL